MAADGPLTPRGTRLKPFRKGFIDQIKFLSASRVEKGWLRLFSHLFFFVQVRGANGVSAGFPQQRAEFGARSSPACQHTRRGGGSPPSVRPSGIYSLFWVQSHFYFPSFFFCEFYQFVSVGGLRCRTGRCRLLFSGRWLRLGSFVAVAFYFLSLFRVEINKIFFQSSEY